MDSFFFKNVKWHDFQRPEFMFLFFVNKKGNQWISNGILLTCYATIADDD